MADEVVDRRLNLPPMLTPGEVARVMRVDPKTVTRWAKSGRVNSVKTPGGHRRFTLNLVIGLLTAAGMTYDEATELIAQKVRR